MGEPVIFEKIVSATRAYFKKAGVQSAVVGLSGGIDSSLVAKILVEALGKGHVFGIIMPVDKNKDNANAVDAQNLANLLGIKCELVEIGAPVARFENLPWKQTKISKANVAARIRMATLYNFANAHNCLVAGTGNRSEALLGYATKYGDLGCDILPIAAIYKTQVFAIAKAVGLPEKIISKAPSAGLWDGQTDEGELGAPYSELDKILVALFDKKRPAAEVKRDFSPQLVERVLERNRVNAHKLEFPFAVKI